MDPTACLKRLLEAIAERDMREAKAALSDLTGWINSGGFVPADAGACVAFMDALKYVDSWPTDIEVARPHGPIQVQLRRMPAAAVTP